jgi:hypothetical protein
MIPICMNQIMAVMKAVVVRCTRNINTSAAMSLLLRAPYNFVSVGLWLGHTVGAVCLSGEPPLAAGAPRVVQISDYLFDENYLRTSHVLGLGRSYLGHLRRNA